MGQPSVDQRRLPLVVITYKPNVTVEQYRAMNEECCRIAATEGRVAYLVDCRAFSPISIGAKERKEAAEILKQHRDVLARSTICEARVVPSRLVRGIMTAFDWLTGDAWPKQNCATIEAAEAWIEHHLDREGLKLPRRTGTMGA